MSIINKPHDKFFKETLGDIETTKNFLRNYLPAEILDIIDIDSISAEKDSFIDEELKELFSDLLFKTFINGKEGYIYFLFEHKSYLSERTPLQLLKYMIAIWEQVIHSRNRNGRLPIIIPLVVYHGEDKWNIGVRFKEMIEGIDDLPEKVKKYIPNYEYLLYDLSIYGDEKIKGEVKLRIFLEMLRAIFNKDFDEFMQTFERSIEALEKLESQEKGIDYFETLVKYIMNARNDINIEDVYKSVKRISLERSEEIMTIAEQLIEKGIEKGIIEGKRKTAKNLLSLGLPVEQIAKVTELSVKEIMLLKREI